MVELGRPVVQRKLGIKNVQPFNKRVFVDRMSSFFTGAGIILLGGILRGSGDITPGDEPDDPKKAKSFKQKVGALSHALKVAGQLIPLSSLEHIGLLFQWGAIWREEFDSDKKFAEALFSGVYKGINAVFSQALLQTSNAILYGGIYGDEKYEGIAGVPFRTAHQGLRQLNARFGKEVDAFATGGIYETYGETFSETMMNEVKVIMRTLAPFGSVIFKDLIPNKLGMYGEEIEKDISKNKVGRFFDAFIKPFYSRTDPMTKPVMDDITMINKNLLTVYDKVKDNKELKSPEDIFPSINYSGNFTGEMNGKEIKIKFDIEDYQAYNKLYGENNLDKLKKYFNSDHYRNNKDKNPLKVAERLKSKNNESLSETKKTFWRENKYRLIEKYSK